MGIGTHAWRKHGAGVGWNENNKNKIAWNRGLTKETDDRIKKIANTWSTIIKQKIRNGEYIMPKMTNERKKALSILQSMNNRGGKCKWYDFKKDDNSIIKAQGKLELSFLNMFYKYDKNIDRSRKTFEWKDTKNTIRRYTPDFYSPMLDLFFEIKGYWWKDDKEKMRRVVMQNPNLKIVLFDYADAKIFNMLL